MSTATAQADASALLATDAVSAVGDSGQATLTTPADNSADSAADSDDKQDSKAKRASRRPPPTGAELDQIAKKAKADFARQYQGAKLSMSTQIRNHVVVSAYNRMWAPVLRNWNTSMTVLRSVMTDSAAASGVEQQLLTLLTKISTQFEARSKQLDHLLSDNKDATLAFKSLAYQNPVNDAVVIIGPVSFKFRTVLMEADNLIDKAMVAYTIGEMESQEFEKLKWDIKRALKHVDSLARNLRAMALQKSREAGLARPGYKSANGSEVEAGEEQLLETH